MTGSHLRLALVAGLLAGAMPVHAGAQSIGYGGGFEGGDGASSDDDPGDRPSRRGGKQVEVTPYIEAAQVVGAELSPGDDVLTYSRLAAGVDATIAGRNNAASLSLRYERRFGWGKEEDGDTISGLARGYTTIAQGLRFEVGALAARNRIEGNGAAVLGPIGDDDSVTQIYSVYAGPSLATQVGDVDLTAGYQIGYTRVEEPDSLVVAPGQPAVDVFDHSTAHMANVRAGVAPGTVLPVGVGVGANYYREDISNLDQRIEDFRARADVTWPVTGTVALVGGVGYENVEISGRDAVRDSNGLPVVGGDGRFLTDKSAPRQIAYDTSGFIWDAGVIWRPSRRTSFEAHIGRRYGSTSVYGSFAYAPNARSSLNVSVYDNVSGYGGQVNRALADLPAEFSAVRNPLTGDIGGCVAALEGGNCLSGVLGSVRSATFRARGIAATYSVDLGRLTAGVGAGHDRRKFIAAPGTVLASANGVVDRNTWVAAYLSGRIDARSGFSTSVYANWFDTAGTFGDTSAVGANAAYNRNLTSRLTATAALGIEGVNRETPLEDLWTASALVGVRYSF